MAEIQEIIERIDFRWDHGFIDKDEYFEKRVQLEREIEALRPIDYDDLQEAADLIRHFRTYWDQCADVDEPDEARQQLLVKIGSSTWDCKIIRRSGKGRADQAVRSRGRLESAQTGQIGLFSPLVLLNWPGFGAPGNANYTAVGISGVRRMSPTVITRSVIPRAMAGVRSRYLRFKPGTGSRNDSCGRAR